MYQPKPINTAHIEFPEELIDLIERLAENSHDIWARQRIKDGWVYGPERNDTNKEHPDLVPYNELPEDEKKYDRDSAIETIKSVIALGYGFRKSALNTQR